MRVPVRLLATDSVHGFIDFEYAGGISASKDERRERKRAAARALQDSIGLPFAAVITGVSAKATWLRTEDGIDGRLVRGHTGLIRGDRIMAILLTADPVRGFIDFAREVLRSPERL
jgi:exoribonuclease-2